MYIYVYITYNICTKIHIRIITDCSVNRRHGSLLFGLFARAKACPLTANSTFNMMEAATVIDPRNWGGAGYEWRCWFSQLRFGDIWSRCTVGVLFFRESLVLVWHFMEVSASLQDELCLQLRMENLLYVVVVKWERSSRGQDRTNGCIYIYITTWCICNRIVGESVDDLSVRIFQSSECIRLWVSDMKPCGTSGYIYIYTHIRTYIYIYT